MRRRLLAEAVRRVLAEMFAKGSMVLLALAGALAAAALGVRAWRAREAGTA